MATVPDKINDKIAFFEQRISSWSLTPTAIGLNAAQCTALASAIVNARKSYTDAQAARIAAKNATVNQTSMVRLMATLGADAIRFIRAYAESQPTQDAMDAVFQKASIDPPAPPTPAGAPDAPKMVTADPNADGTVTIKWKGSTANQTFFSIWRKIGNSTTWMQLSSVATKSFIDTTVPGGTPTATYFIRAQRNNQVSPASDEAVVNFGQALAA
ncbi:MAG TPA: hypothetical protein VHC70_02485 [Phycisphaerales bacterium]|nr:hypothetical protein [Phycisphaerales bacterium]